MASKRILILMSDTGGGHRASAEAIADAFSQYYCDTIQTRIVDFWIDYTCWPLNQIPKSYRFLVSDGLSIWRFLWEVGERRAVIRVGEPLLAAIIYGPARELFLGARPDLILSVHPLMQHIPLRILHWMGWKLPFATVVTDLASTPAAWYDPRVDLCCVASAEAQRRAHQMGLRDEQVRLLGLPIRLGFGAQLPERETLRTTLGMDVVLPTVLLVGGGEGMGPVAATARAIAKQLSSAGSPRGQMVVICGRNERLRRELAAEQWRIPTTILGFVRNMPEWMSASDCIVTKAGPGTIVEALACGLPILLSSHIPGQEEGNIPFVVDNGVGAYIEDPAEIARAVANWLQPDNQQLREMKARARQLARPHATLDIAAALAELVGVSRAY